jgi:hypothetical protein
VLEGIWSAEAIHVPMPARIQATDATHFPHRICAPRPLSITFSKCLKNKLNALSIGNQHTPMNSSLQNV